MKPSGIAWIGDIPASWDVVRIKDIGTYRNGLTYAPEDVTEDDNGTLVLRSSNIQNGKISYDDKVYVKCSISTELMVKKGDIIICSRNGSRELIGKNAIVEDSGLTCSFGAFMMVYRCSCPRYIYYILNSEVFSYYLGTFLTSTINQLTGSNFGNMKIVFCTNCNEQRAIADYLDSQCAKIDSIAADLKKQIELLQKYKKSLITETVTKGLDKSVPMKDSGIEWIGEIPCTWNAKKIKYICNLVRGGSPRPIDNFLSNDDNDVNWIRIGDTEKGLKYINSTLLKVTNLGASRSRIVLPGTLLLTNSMSFGQPYILNITGCIHDGWLAFSDYQNVEKEYLYYTLMAYYSIKQFEWAAIGAVVENLSVDKVGNSYIAVPPLNVQTQIVSFLDEKLRQIENVIEMKQTQLDQINGHKKSLIYEYVTGKKRVKEAAQWQ